MYIEKNNFLIKLQVLFKHTANFIVFNYRFFKNIDFYKIKIFAASEKSKILILKNTFIRLILKKKYPELFKTNRQALFKYPNAVILCKEDFSLINISKFITSRVKNSTSLFKLIVLNNEFLINKKLIANVFSLKKLPYERSFFLQTIRSLLLKFVIILKYISNCFLTVLQSRINTLK